MPAGMPPMSQRWASGDHKQVAEMIANLPSLVSGTPHQETHKSFLIIDLICVFNIHVLVTDYGSGIFSLPTELSPVVAAFLDLKNSPDSLDDMSDFSESVQSDSHVCYHMLHMYV